MWFFPPPGLKVISNQSVMWEKRRGEKMPHSLWLWLVSYWKEQVWAAPRCTLEMASLAGKLPPATVPHSVVRGMH